MTDDGPDDERRRAAKRMLTALRMFPLGRAMKLQSLRREHPEASEEELRVLLGRWLRREDEELDPVFEVRRYE